MRIELPKPMRTFAFTDLTMVELNDTDVQRMLTQVFEMAIKQGRAAANTKAATLYNEKRAALAASGRLEGFEDHRGSAVLDGWLRSSVVEMGRVGRKRASEQMQYFRPNTVAVYRAGFPARARHRQADRLVYLEMLREAAARLPGEDATKAKVWLGERFRESFGRGVVFSDPPKWAPSYDGHSEVDISALVAIYFLQEFEAKSAVDVKGVSFSPIPAATAPLGRDVLDYITSYGSHAPALVMSQHLAALIGVRLFQLPLRTARAARTLIETGELVPDMTNADESNPLEQYVDFTGEKGSPSDALARECVQRGLEATRQFFWDRMYLLAVRGAPVLRGIFDDPALSAADRLRELVKARGSAQVTAHLEYQLSLIAAENEDTEDEDTASFLAAILRDPRPAADRVADVLVEALKKRGYENAIKWFWSTGGIKTDVGLLSGPLNARRSWTYAASDILLASLLAVTFTRPGGAAPRAEMSIAELLEQFERRFGLLIDRPPKGMDSAEHRAAAAQNLEAFKYRLQLLGAFDGLSDDFNAQRVRNPLINLLEEA